MLGGGGWGDWGVWTRTRLTDIEKSFVGSMMAFLKIIFLAFFVVNLVVVVSSCDLLPIPLDGFWLVLSRF